MATHSRAPKQWSLTKTETINSFENWKQNLTYIFAEDKNFAPFLAEGCTWLKKSPANPTRGFTNDGDTIAAANRKTGAQKVQMLELMLGQVANFCPVISRHTLVNKCTSIDLIWQTIRTHYGFQITGSHFLNFAEIKLDVEERPEDLYQRLEAFIHDNLLHRGGTITHHGDNPDTDEEITQTVENLIVLTWLRLIHPELPRLVKQRYGTELRCRTLASIKPEISQALDSLVEEVRSAADVKVLRSGGYQRLPTDKFKQKFTLPTKPPAQRTTAQCVLCRQANRPHDHFLSRCRYLPDNDKRFMARARQISAHEVDEVDHASYVEPTEDQFMTSDLQTLNLSGPILPSGRRVHVKHSPYLNAFHIHIAVHITLDSGAEANMIKISIAQFLGAVITKSSQVACQADGKSPMTVVGETRMIFTRDSHKFVFDALVVEELDVDILGGVPFLDMNDITIRVSKHEVILNNGTTYTYGHTPSKSGPHAVRLTQAHLVRAPSVSTTVWPGEYVEVNLPGDYTDDMALAIEPRADTVKSINEEDLWPLPQIVNPVGNKVRLLNSSNGPKVLQRNIHICQVMPAITPPEVAPQHINESVSTRNVQPSPVTLQSGTVKLNPDNILPTEIVAAFRETLIKYDDVFSTTLGMYNGYFGPFEAVVNMGPVQPPQRKGRVPQYSRDKLLELQEKFDTLETAGVFKKPEDVGIVAEYLNPSFLIKKPNGSYRLVTAFADVGRYTKPQPALMPDVDSTLRQIAQWKYIIVTDLTSAFYQIPLSASSMKYCGVVTPFRGVRMYTRSAMGMPGSETALEELMNRVLGDLVQEGIVAKLADDLYCGANTIQQLLDNWQRLLQTFLLCGMKLSATKTVIAPKSTTILGWIWSNGHIQASPHRIATISSCQKPTTVKGLRSFIGAYKALSRVMPQCATFVAPLDGAIAGGQSSDKVTWTEDLCEAFANAQGALKSCRSVTLPRSTDTLWIVTDGAVKSRGVGATMYVVRDGKPKVAGFFSAKLRHQQVTWLPCEIEALSIAAAVKHFSPYIIQSDHNICILTDSKPCVQAFEKLCRGEFSASPRVSTFLATVSRYQASLRHLAGSANIPSDFASRNAPDCTNVDCQICSFIARTEDSVVRHTTTQDITSGTVKLPFTSRTAWNSIQLDCTDLRRTHAHLTQGTRPSRKLTNIRDIKRYLRVATIAKDGLLVVKRTDALASPRECVIVPRQVLDGLIMALHIKLNHPTCSPTENHIPPIFLCPGHG